MSRGGIEPQRREGREGNMKGTRMNADEEVGVGEM